MYPDALVSFTLFGKQFSIHLYGIFIAIGILCCLIVFFVYTKKRHIDQKVQDFAFICVIVAIALGFLFAKLYQAIYDYIENPSRGFDFYNAGITAMGGFIGGAAVFIIVYFGIGAAVFRGDEKGLNIKHFNTILCVAPICILIAHAFGRIGCLCAGCCHGKYLGSQYVFGGIYMKCNGVAGYYVPTQLYESIFLFILFGITSILYFDRSNITVPIYLISYGVWRIIIEFFRADERGAIILGLAPSQWQSIIFILGGIIFLVVYKLIHKPYKLSKQAIEDLKSNRSVG